mmetsp:Transcript_1741/g.4047  ORF Transcript_1741/g.4047 Transcript_1741/m.4047 type:complete len:252 (+) Transcript_1741:783-1538(+)
MSSDMGRFPRPWSANDDDLEPEPDTRVSSDAMELASEPARASTERRAGDLMPSDELAAEAPELTLCSMTSSTPSLLRLSLPSSSPELRAPPLSRRSILASSSCFCIFLFAAFGRCRPPRLKPHPCDDARCCPTVLTLSMMTGYSSHTERNASRVSSNSSMSSSTAHTSALRWAFVVSAISPKNSPWCLLLISRPLTWIEVWPSLIKYIDMPTVPSLIIGVYLAQTTGDRHCATALITLNESTDVSMMPLTQ